MKYYEEIVKDPVCGMMVNSRQFAVEYLHLHYAFCSKQCRERFLSNPGLYVGRPGEKSPKQEGKFFVKRRKINFAAPIAVVKRNELQEHLRSMMGVEKVIITESYLVITYDLLQATARQIEAVILTSGVQLGDGWNDRLRRTWVHFEEEALIGGMEVPPTGGQGGSCH